MISYLKLFRKGIGYDAFPQKGPEWKSLAICPSVELK